MSRKSSKTFSPGFRRLFASAAGKRIFPRALTKELQFEDDLPYVTLQADGKTILTRGGELMQCIRVAGLNAMTASDADIDALKNLIAEIVMQAGAQYSFYVHRISRALKPVLAPMRGNELAHELDAHWTDLLTAQGLRDKTLTVTIINRPAGLVQSLTGVEKLRELVGRMKDDSRKNPLTMFVADKEARIGELDETVGVVLSSLSDYDARVLNAESGELLGFLEGIGTGIEAQAYESPEIALLSRSIANHRVTFNGTKIIISGGSVPNRYGQIFTIKNYARKPFAGMFDALNLPIDMVVTNSFVPISDDMARELFRRGLHQRRSISDAARTDQEEMQIGQDRVASGLESFGYHHMTVAIYADNEETLAMAAADVRTIAHESGTKVITEAFAGQGHYFAQWPGNATYRARTGLISNRAFASMASLHRLPTGLPGEALPWQTPVAVFPTPEKSGYLFSFHPAGRPDQEPPAGHSIIFGPTGGGKSVLLSFLAAQVQRVNARVFAFDYRRGLEVQIEALGGKYSTISPDIATGLNPLYSQTDAVGQMWLTDWLTALLDRRDKPFSPLQIQMIHDAVVQNASAPDGLRNFSNFPALFSHVDDGGDLEQRVKEWSPGGRYGWVFGSNATDNFALDQQIMGFDLTALLDSDHEKERTAILGYLFQRLERTLQDRHPTVIFVDEAWKALATDYFAAKLQNWLVTTRKLNAVVVMVTQFPSQLELSLAGRSMLQAVQTQILLPNRNAKAENYSALDLNDRELAAVLFPEPGSRLALIRNNVSSVVVDLDLSALGDDLKLLGGGQPGRAVLEARTRSMKKETA